MKVPHSAQALWGVLVYNMPMQRNFLFLTFLSVALMGFLHHLGSYYFLYWTIGGVDMVMHFLGGLSVALIFVWGYYFSGVGGGDVSVDKRLIMKTFLFVMIIGVAWEYFEYYFKIANPTKGNYVEDTTLDLIFDALGALLVGIISNKKINS